ncbi:sterol desaturase family protein [Pedobacter sp. SL55]|uniref:sterol desaturase family protein n=1 Tax=Pedobacter sp. SL55 TaxID=2995161 RepID=UPI0022703C49|nr:sterol desaturase family protein [Pedobacter sp. SL55]WAC42391.1 sterol desaturase family protein [Pedobacter sp. SL55]
MAKNFISNSSESTRMFKSDLLEPLSKVKYYVPLIIFVPLIVFLVWKALFDVQTPVLEFFGWLAFGLFVWTITEYVMHRWVFHFYPKAAWAKRIHFIFHGVHHDYPNDANRLVMPPSASIPLALAFWFLFDWLLPETKIYSFFIGFIGGYLFYDMVHYALHHANFKSGLWKRLKHHHMLHHYQDASKGFGVSWMFWDGVFRSGFEKKKETQ